MSLSVDEQKGSATREEKCGSLSALRRAFSIQEKAARFGFDWSAVAGPLDKLREETDELTRAITDDDRLRIEMEIGDILFSAVNVARHMSIDPESALEKTSFRFEERFARLRSTLADRGVDINDCSLEQMDEIWELVKCDE